MSKENEQGAIIISTDEKSWFNHAIEMIEAAKFVFVLPGTTERLLREIDVLNKSNYFTQKTNFIFPIHDSDSRWESVCKHGSSDFLLFHHCQRIEGGFLF